MRQLCLGTLLINWFTDNQCVLKILEGGSMKEPLHKMVLEIYYCTRKNNTSLEVEWIPRNENEKADYLSKVTVFDDVCQNKKVNSQVLFKVFQSGHPWG